MGWGGGGGRGGPDPPDGSPPPSCLTESKHENYVQFRYGLNSTTAELHSDVIGRCKVLIRNDIALT